MMSDEMIITQDSEPTTGEIMNVIQALLDQAHHVLGVENLKLLRQVLTNLSATTVPQSVRVTHAHGRRARAHALRHLHTRIHSDTYTRACTSRTRAYTRPLHQSLTSLTHTTCAHTPSSLPPSLPASLPPLLTLETHT